MTDSADAARATGIIEELAQSYADVGKRYADIGPDLTLGAYPFPHIAVHAQMQLLDELSREKCVSARYTRKLLLHRLGRP